MRQRRGRGLRERAIEIQQREPGRGRASGPDQSTAALPDYGILFVVCEKPFAETLADANERIIGDRPNATAPNDCLIAFDPPMPGVRVARQIGSGHP